MKFSLSTTLALLVTPVAVFAQMDSICDKYTKALFKNNTAENQYTLLVKLVNTALIGNYTAGSKAKVNGILVPGTFMNQNVSLLHYFNGGLLSTNRGKPSSTNFIDGGGAIPLAQDMPANDETSNQYKLVTHLYQFFGALLQCSMYGKTGFAAYGGNPSMYEVHKFMNLGPNEMGYFIQEVALSAASFGVAEADIKAVGAALDNTFNRRCSPQVAVLPSASPALQAICVNSACSSASSPTCAAYSTAVEPATATATPGPQLTDLAPQLSSIAAGEVTPNGAATTSGGAVKTSVFTSDGTVMTAVVTTGAAGSGTMTQSPNAAPLQTVGPIFMALVGAGIVGQMF
ncbi:hypothetical protein ABW20_dc0110667 [Dactylellina cionopaga]|nr:hypothetical protein ABW20_dc0110667 [Dactylellina cionopaga]